jgi:hypothetical protein
MKYRIEIENKISELEEKVNYLIEKGWEPLGGIGVSSNNYYCQALIKK